MCLHVLIILFYFSFFRGRRSSWIYNYLCNKCRSPLTLWVQIPLRRGVLDTALCDTVCQWLVADRWFSPGPPVSSTNKTDRHDITEILLKVTLSTIKKSNNQTNKQNHPLRVVSFRSKCNKLSAFVPKLIPLFRFSLSYCFKHSMITRLSVFGEITPYVITFSLISRSFPHSWLIISLLTRATRREPLVEQELLTLGF